MEDFHINGEPPLTQVEAALLRMGYARLRQSVLLTVVVVLIFTGLLGHYFPPAEDLLWLGSLLLAAVLRYALWWAHRRAGPAANESRTWRRLFVAAAALGGVSWGIGPVLMLPSVSTPVSLLLVLALLAVCAVAMEALSPQLHALWAFLLAALLPSAIGLAATGRDIEAMAAGVLVAAMASLMIVGRGASRSIRALLQTEMQLSQAVREIDAQRQRAEAASHAKTRFLANMSHELRTPLNAVIGAAQLMRAGDGNAEQRVELVDAIQRSGTNLLGLIENILDLSRIEAGEVALEHREFHFLECIDSALATAGLAARAKGLKLASIVAADLPAWRVGDALRVRQLLINLLGNAVKFTHRGQIVVDARCGSAPGEVLISVTDTGVGISAAQLPQVFEPFRQADDGAERRFGGSGLGLAIVRQLAQAMGGEVYAISTPGQGSSFWLSLPLPAAERGAEPPPLGCRVGYFEPHEPSALALRATLGRMGCEGTRCHDAAELQAWCRQAAEPGPPAWLLVCTDSNETLPLLESAAPWLDAERIVGMSSEESFELESARLSQHIPRSVTKPVLRSALVSRFGVADPLPASRPPGRATAAASARPSVLLVEDDALNLAIVTRMLQHAGFPVQTAHNGQTALQTLREQNFDVVLMDWQMPDMDGLEVTRRLRAGEAGEAAQRVAVVALTANAFAEDRQACLAVGMNDFLTKPVLAARLISTIERWAPVPAEIDTAEPVGP